MQNEDPVHCPVCETGTIVCDIIEIPLMFMPTGVGILPENIASPYDALIFRCSNPECQKLFSDALGDCPIAEQPTA